MKIIIDNGKEFNVEDKYFDSCKVGIDKAIEDLVIKSNTTTVNDIDWRFQEGCANRGMSEVEIIGRYVDNKYGILLHILHIINKNCLKNNTLTLRVDWFEYGLNDIFVKYCGFSLLRQPSNLGEFVCESLG